MTGTVTWEVLIWMAGTGSVALLTGWRIVIWVLTELRKRDAAIDKLEKEAGLMIGASDSRAKLAEDELRRSLADHKLYAAENFATEGGLTQAVNRVDDAVKRLTDRMDRYFEKGEKGG
jgi:hypothetical protein